MKDNIIIELENAITHCNNDDAKKYYIEELDKYKKEKDRVDTLKKACKQLFTVEASFKDKRQNNNISYYLLKMADGSHVVTSLKIIYFIKEELFKDCYYHKGILKAKRSFTCYSYDRHVGSDGKYTSIKKLKVNENEAEKLKEITKSDSLELLYNKNKEYEVAKYIITELAKVKYGDKCKRILNALDDFVKDNKFIKIIDTDTNESVYASITNYKSIDGKIIPKIVMTDTTIKMLDININIICTINRKPKLEIVSGEYTKRLYRNYGIVDIAETKGLELSIEVNRNTLKVVTNVPCNIRELLYIL